MRPLFPFYGSKWNIARYYPRPLHETVVEPFAGGAGYSLYYEPHRVMLVDADPILVGVWDYLLRATPADILRLPELPNVGDCVDDFDLPQEAKWLIGFWLNRGSATPKKSRTAYSARTDKAQLNWGARAKERIAQALTAWDRSAWSVQQGDYTTTPTTTSATYFIDPPYVDKGRFYRTKFTDHVDLGQWCKDLAAPERQVIACEGEGAIWLPFAPLGSFKSSKGRATERVWIAP